jgi:protein-tyrosine phosphatase
MGVSRSGSIVLGYLMSKEKRTLTEALELIKKNRFVRLNI